jgi:lipopolysaccharide/colanic/teichoic acid biosynthesis glycosyltransferase
VAKRQAGGLAAVEDSSRPLEEASRGGRSAAAKRALDVMAAVLALVVLAPFFVLLAALIVAETGRPVFHRRRVLGRGGIPFDALKFRTMRLACRAGGPQPAEKSASSIDGLPAGTLTAQGDPRITGVGRWLRRLSLDELPQLFNVLRGEMSLVGPRMLAPEEHDALAIFPDWQQSVLAVKPGITGLWQVSGRRLLPYEERTRLDLEYVRSATLWTDVLILLRTVPAVLSGRGAF